MFKNKIKILLVALVAVSASLVFTNKARAYQIQPDYSVSKSWSSGPNHGIIWANWNGLSSNKIAQIQMYLSNGDSGVTWKLCLANRALGYFPCSQAITVTSTGFYTFPFATSTTLNENDLFYANLNCYSGAHACGYADYAWHINIYGSPNTSATTSPYGGDATPVKAYYFKLLTQQDIPIPFAITSPQNNDPEIRDTWITVSGTCPINGTNRIGFTNDCLGFDKINYNVSCVSNTFAGQFYYDGLGDKRVIARDASSTSGDCVDYDDKMDFKTVRSIEVINGYPNDWYFNFDYYNDYDIKIKSPAFDTALTLPIGSTSSLFTFQFIYPASSTLSNLNFTIKQYLPDGTLLNGSYHTKLLSLMGNTQSYAVNLDASSTTPLHYVVQLTDTGVMKRQYPFAIYVSDINFTANTDATNYLFPRLVEALKKKIVFNYFFTFHDGFANLFNASSTAVASSALDISFKTVSADKQYNTNIQIFSASDPNVKNFAAGLRPYIVAFLWLAFALYVVLRITHLFSGSSGNDK